MTTLNIGDKAPNFTLPIDGGETFSLDDLKGKPSVIYFYPRDDTPGCTKEAIAFTAHKSDFDALGIKIIGVSKDTVAKHEKFKTKHDLNVTLISDAEGQMCEDFGVWVEKNMYGKKYMGIQRATFLLDGESKIAHIWPKVKVAGHAKEVLSKAKELFA